VTRPTRGTPGRPEATPGFRDRLLIGAVVAIGPAIIRMLGSTWRVRFINSEVVDGVHATGRRMIYAFWHCHILPLGFNYRGRGVVVLSSLHRDGEISARLMQALGFVVERGSTTRGSVSGLVRMVRRAREGRDLAISPDGPKGPARVAKAGIAFLALKAGGPIVPLGVGVDRCTRLSGWDRFVIPHPFARVVVLHGEPYEVEPGSDLNVVAELLTAELERLQEQAQVLAEDPSRADARRGGGSGDAGGRGHD